MDVNEVLKINILNSVVVLATYTVLCLPNLTCSYPPSLDKAIITVIQQSNKCCYFSSDTAEVTIASILFSESSLQNLRYCFKRPLR